MSSPEDVDRTPIARTPGRRCRSRLVYDNPWIRVREDQVLRPDGLPGIYGVVEFKNRAVGVLPVDRRGPDLAGRASIAIRCKPIPGRSPREEAPRPNLPKRPRVASCARRPD